MLVHFDRWSHRYDEWILWDSSRLRPLERPTLRKEGLKEEEDMTVCIHKVNRVYALWIALKNSLGRDEFNDHAIRPSQTHQSN